MPNQVSKLLDTSLAEADLLKMAPEVFLRTLIDVIPGLADEFCNIDISLAEKTIPFFCATVRRGKVEHSVALGIAMGCAETALRDRIDSALRDGLDPGVDFFNLPARVEEFIGSGKNVKISVSSDAARQLVEYLQLGLEDEPSADYDDYDDCMPCP